ncbi:MAG: serine/threonine protein kinase [Pirellulales bacterium]
MANSIEAFWKLALASRLLDAATCRELHAQFAAQAAPDRASAEGLADWLVAAGKLSRYQASVLLSGRPGPFVFGDFVITERIEAGRLARAFRAVYKGSLPALVWFDATANESPAQAKATAARLATARGIKSPHVARLYQLHTAAAPPFFVLEDLRGQSLRERLAGAPLAAAECCRVARDAALGLAVFQDLGLVHGNVSPDNIWLDASSPARLLHYPLAAPLLAAARQTLPAAEYLAPELVDPGRAADARSDIYALGCVIYELLVGSPPFGGGDATHKPERHRHEVPAALDQALPGTNVKLAQLVGQMLAKDPAARPQSARAVAETLAVIVAEPQQTIPSTGAQRQLAAAAAPLPVARPAAPPASTTAAAAAAASPAESAPFIVVDTGIGQGPLPSDARSAIGPRRRRSSATIVALGAGLTLVAVVIVAGFWMRGADTAAVATSAPVAARDLAQGGGPALTNAPGSNTAPSAPNPVAEKVAAAPTASPNARQRAGVIEIDDDGQTLWTSPTAGEPLDVRYVPSGTLVLVALRPAEILASDEGARLLDALGPTSAAVQDKLHAVLGVELSQVKQLLVAFVPDDAGRPQTAYVARLASAADEAALLRAWGNPQPAVQESASYFQGNGRAYYLPADGAGRVLVVAPPAVVQEVIGRAGEPVLQTSLENLLRTSDASRHVSLLAAPSYLFTDGRELLAGDLAKLRGPLAQMFDMSMRGVLASAHIGEELFLELRALGPSDRRPDEVADTLRTRLAGASEALEQYVASLAPQPYGRLVVHRFGRMVQLASSFTRAAAENRQAVLRCYLPASAAHNLVLGAELTLAEAPAGVTPAPAVAGTPMPPAAAANGVATALDRVVSLSFPRDTLEHALELLAADMEVPIVIRGEDLQLEGITKNQSFGLDERKQPAGQILRKVLALANADGKLVYTIKADQQGRETIFVTTRAAAAQRNDPLPAGFERKSPAK